MVSNKNAIELQEYIQDEVTVEYFKANFLSINQNKTAFSIVAGNEDEEVEIYIMTKYGTILESKKNIKFLGIKFNEHNNMERDISCLESKIGLMYTFMKPFIK